jgi:HNH endonuclease
MRCLFFKSDSTASRSIEHIIPESLGNMTQILPPGVVCDGCNNYFSRKVEGLFMESPSLTLMRFHQAVANKRGRVPPIAGVMLPSVPVVLHRHPKSEVGMSADVPTEFFDSIAKSEKGTLILPTEAPPPDERIVSRFLAKVALEAMAQRLLRQPAE